MIKIYPSSERFKGRMGMMNFFSTFPFQIPNHPLSKGFGPLAVIDEAYIRPGMIFGMHTHRDDEIVSYIRRGTIMRRDSGGTDIAMSGGFVGLMSAGTGMAHEEYVPVDGERVEMYQIAIRPYATGLTPAYHSAVFPRNENRGKLRLIVSPDGRDRSLKINQEISLYDATLSQRQPINWKARVGQSTWLLVCAGEIQLDQYNLKAGDSAAISADSDSISLRTSDIAEILLFEVNLNAEMTRTGSLSG